MIAHAKVKPERASVFLRHNRRRQQTAQPRVKPSNGVCATRRSWRLGICNLNLTGPSVDNDMELAALDRRNHGSRQRPCLAD